MTREDELALLQRAQRDDAAAFEEIVRAHEKVVYHMALQTLGNREDAQDAVQDVFLKLWQTNRAFYHLQNPREQQLYLYRCINNACYDWIKHNNVVANHSGPIATDIRNEEIYWYERLIENEDFQCKVKRILQEVDTLPDRCREIFSRRYIKQQKPSEIALELCISVRTVEAQLYKALNVLRKNLNEKK